MAGGGSFHSSVAWYLSMLIRAPSKAHINRYRLTPLILAILYRLRTASNAAVAAVETTDLSPYETGTDPSSGALLRLDLLFS